MLWAKAKSSKSEEEQILPFVNFKLRLSRIALYCVIVIAIITGGRLIAETLPINLFGFISIIVIAFGGVFFSFYSYHNKSKYAEYLFLLIPLFALIVAKFINANLYILYNESFTAYYFFQIALSYLLCSPKIGLVFSLSTLFAILAPWMINGAEMRVLDNYNAILLIFATVVGFIISRYFESDSINNEIKKSIDEQTGLLNASGFVKKLKHAIAVEKQFYVVLFAFDKFNEQFNDDGADSIQNASADKFLKTVAARLVSVQRSFLHARLAKSKFVFISTAENALVLTAQLEELEKDIDARCFELHNLPEGNTLSLLSGIVCFPSQAEDISQILSYAEISLERSRTNKNNVKNVFFMREYLDDKNRLSTIQKDIFSACLNGELQVFYQPKVSLIDKEVTGMEALARWTHPSVGYIPPNEFVDIAEKSGHILALGEYVLESAFYHIKQVHKVCSNNINVSINISPTQLLQPNFTEKILNRAKNFGVDPSVVYLEITEGTMLKSGANAILEGLKNEGFNLSLDDFGTGYSSLNYLHKYSFDELKIDKTFTDGLMRGRNERKLFRFLILLAKELGMRTVTEGVEDEVQIRLLKNLGAEEIQGWYYSKALPSFDCIEYIRKFRFTDDDTDDPNTFGANGSFSVVDTPKTEK